MALDRNINPYNAYSAIINEYFDIQDKHTRVTLLSVDEADQSQILTSLATKLYKNIVAKVPDIDYGEIPKSKGDITQIPNYQQMMECLDTVGEIIEYYKESPDSINTIKTSVENLRASKKIWEKAFAIKSELPMVFYSTIALAIVSATSLILSTSVDYVNDPDMKTFDATLNKNRLKDSKNSLLLKNLEEFNKAYAKGDIQKVMDSFMKTQNMVQNEGVKDIITVGLKGIKLTLVIVKSILLVFPIIHELVCMFYSAKQSLSDYFDIQANMIIMNAEKVNQDTSKSEESRKKIYDRQIKVAKMFKKISNALAIKFKSGESKAQHMIDQENNTNYKVDDVVDTQPDSYSDIF